METPDIEWLTLFFGPNFNHSTTSLDLKSFIDDQRVSSNSCFIIRLYLYEECEGKTKKSQKISKANLKLEDGSVLIPMISLGSNRFTAFVLLTSFLDKFQLQIFMREKLYEFMMCFYKYHSNKLEIKLSGDKGIEPTNMVLYQDLARISEPSSFLSSEMYFIAHRGMGATNLYDDRDKYVENTELSFQKAISNGAEWIEFDVQVTRDGKVVIFHDFFITKDDKPYFISNLCFQEFEEIYNSIFNKNRNNVLRLLTLEKLMIIVDESIGFNIEIKYPFTSDVKDITNYRYEDPCCYVKRIVDVVLKHSKKNVFLSSFHPQIILAMKFMNVRYPIYFLSCGGTYKYLEGYCNSLWEAIRFSMMTNINGIILDIKSLANNFSKNAFMLKHYNIETMAYGNGDYDLIMCMSKLGIKGFIVDDINIFYQ